MDDRVHLFGIRHHGPGSAASLIAALDALQPEAVLIEGPPEADPLIAYSTAAGMRPPIALLAYAVDDPGTAVFFPFAAFSPEWQAMRWALRHQRAVRFIDWPAAVSLAVRAPTRSDTTEPAARDARQSEPIDPDPLDRLAEASGYGDGEALWNALVESRGPARDVFAAIAEAMAELRATETADTAATWREARREAHMRLEIRKALKEQRGAIAVVVGAWHVPALKSQVSVADDRAILRDLPRNKIEMSWVPWTETRLAAASGYGAGVTSPAWYGHLWTLYETASAQAKASAFAATWQAKVANLLRAEGYAAAPSSVIDAARLALALGAMRGHATPGLAEMRDATLSALCHGEEAPFRVIETRLVIGDAVGSLDESVPQMPLAADLAGWQRRLRLKPEALEREIALDLRSEAGLAKSFLLHRLNLLDVPWGRLVDAEAGRGTFREVWHLLWTPELSVKLAEALVYGITIAQASAAAAIKRAELTTEIATLADLVRRCLLADLPAAAESCIDRLQAAAVGAGDVSDLMRAVPSLVAILRYGTARKIPIDPLAALVRTLATEVIAGIELACVNLDAEASDKVRAAMIDFDAALTLLADDHLSTEWTRRLMRLIDGAAVAPLLAGSALRILYDRSALQAQALDAAFSRALSPAVPPNDAGRWLEGFLGSAAEVMLQDRTLLDLIDRWLGDQPEESFIEVLPVLRRSFCTFSAPERRRLLAEIDKERRVPARARGTDTLDSPGFRKALPLLRAILGIDSGMKPDDEP